MPTDTILHPRGRVIGVHHEIVLDPNLSLSAKGLYGALLLNPHGSASELSRILEVSRDTVSSHLKELEKAGWAKRPSSRVVCPAQPKEVRQRQAERFEQLLSYHPYIGEHLSFCWLDELIDSDDYVDHARPQFLKNPVTNQPMEYDRIYPTYKKAFEHQGLQHFGPTEKFPDLNKAREQELRDWAKLGISSANGIELVTITWEDLSLQGMLAKVPNGLPRRLVDPKDPYIRCLEQESAKYRATMERIKGDQDPRRI